MTVDLELLTHDEAERLIAVIEALDAGHVSFQWSEEDGPAPHLAQNATTEPALLALFDSKAAVLAAAKELATLHGRPKPRSATAAASDPVLAALLLASTTTNQQKADPS